MAQIKTVAQAAKRIEALEAQVGEIKAISLFVEQVAEIAAQVDKLEDATKIENIAVRLQGEMNWMPRK